MGQYFHTINHAIQVFFRVSFLGFVDAPVMCILDFIKTSEFFWKLHLAMDQLSVSDGRYFWQNWYLHVIQM